MAQKLSFVVKMTEFLVCEPFFFFIEQRKRVNEDLNLFACFNLCYEIPIKSHAGAFDQNFVTRCFGGKELFF